MRKALSPSEKATSATATVEQESKEDEDEKILNEMEELTNAMERKKKRAKKLLAKRQSKVFEISSLSCIIFLIYKIELYSAIIQLKT